MIQVLCKRGAANKQGPSISNPLIVSTAQAAAVGKRFLDDPNQGGYYITKTYDMTLNCNTMAVHKNDWISGTIAKLNLTARAMRVTSVSFTGNAKGAITTLEVQTYE